jgi:hypothetical protein
VEGIGACPPVPQGSALEVGFEDLTGAGIMADAKFRAVFIAATMSLLASSPRSNYGKRSAAKGGLMTGQVSFPELAGQILNTLHAPDRHPGL